MAIVKMQEMTILALVEDRSALLNELQNLGVMEIEDVDVERNALEKDALEQSLMQNQRLKNYQQRLDRAIRSLKRRFPEASAAARGVELQAADFFERVENRAAILERLANYERDVEREAAIRSELDEIKREQEILQDWLALEVPLGEAETESTRSRLGSFPSPEAMAAAKAKLIEEDLATAILPLFDKEHPKVAVVSLKNQDGKSKSVMATTDFRPFPLAKEGASAKHFYVVNEERDQALRHELTMLNERLEKQAEKLSDFMLLSDFFNIRRERLNAEARLRRTAYTFMLKGYVPAAQGPALKARLEAEYVSQITLRALGPEENPPILLENPKYIRAFENVLEMFGAPNPSEYDPMPILAPFSFLFFGMMLSDVGYGLLLMAICFFLLKKKKVRGGGAKMVKMLFLCGVSSTLWGFVFGGFFGNLLDKVSMGKLHFPALAFNPLDDPIKLLVWSMLFGVVHLFFGMGIDMHNKIQRGDKKAAWFDVFPWYFIVTGAGLLLGKGSMPASYQDLLGKLGMGMMAAGALVIVLMKGRESKNPIVRLLKGLLGLYDITGFLSDILSYSRVLALVLATSVIALVFNEIGMLLGPTVPGYILFTISAVVGHSINLALSALSAFVHSSRLQYVEFFGRFYEGGGKFFKPLKLETEHFHLAEAAKIPGGPKDKKASEAA